MDAMTAEEQSLETLTGLDARAKTVRGIVRELDGLFLGLELADDDDGAEDLARYRKTISRAKTGKEAGGEDPTSSLTTFI